MLARNTGITIILVVFVALAVGFSLATPPFEAPDEIHHYAFIRDLIRGRALPVQHVGDRPSQRHQPPLYYAMGAVLSFWSAEPDDSPYSVARSNPYWGYAYGEVGGDNKNLYLHGDWDAFPYRGAALGIHVVRLLSVVLGALTVWVTYLVGCELFPRRRTLALGGVALLAFNPMFLFISGAVNNDSLITLLVALVMLQLVLVLKRGLSAIRGLRIGAFVGFALLTKLTALYVLPVVALGLFLAAWPRRDWRGLLRAAFPACAAAIALAGWWFARNLALYGELTSIRLTLQTWHARPEGLNLPQAIAELPNAETSFWARFGYGNVPVPNAIYQGLGMLVRLGLYGCVAVGYTLVRARYAKATVGRRIGRVAVVVAWLGVLFSHSVLPELSRTGRQLAGALAGAAGVLAFQMRHDQSDLWQGELSGVVAPSWRFSYVLILLAGMATAYFAAMVSYMTMSTTAANGRYMFPGLPAMSLLVFVGLAYFVPRRWRSLLVVVLVAGLALLSSFTLLRYQISAYARPPVLPATAVEKVPRNVELDYGGVARLLGVEIAPERIRPGDAIDVRMYWQALAEAYEELATTVQVFGRDRQRIGQRDSFPGLGNYPITEWRPGDMIVDTFRVPLDPQAQAPAELTIDVGLYHPDTNERLAITRPDGQKVDTSTVARARLGPRRRQQFDPQFQVDYRLGPLTLKGYDVVGDTLRPGGELELRLYWQTVESAGKDYTVFVHLEGADGKLWAQQDGQPAGGNYPTGLWEPGEMIEDVHRIALPAEMPPGAYRVAAGVYLLETMQRLPALDAWGVRQTDDRIFLWQGEAKR